MKVCLCSYISPPTLPLWYCRAWERYNADEEITRLEKEEQEEQLGKTEVDPKRAFHDICRSYCR